MIYSIITRTVAKIIGLYNPLGAARYLAQHEFLNKRAYAAAKKGGSDSLWRTPHSSGAQENVNSWQAVTNKARDLARNNPYMVGARRRFRSNLISEGVWPRPKIRNAGAVDKFDLNVKLNQDLLDRWEVWAPTAMANGDSLYQGQRTAANHLFDDGQFLIRRILTRKPPFLRLELLECDYLDTSMDRSAGNGQNKVVGGIELDKYNAPVKYFLKELHPAENSSLTVTVPAAEIIHVFDRQRASDVSGICGYASVVQAIFRLNEYTYSTMDQARLANHFGIWIETPYADDYASVGAPTTVAIDDSRRYKHIEPAGIHYGMPGETPHQMRPENPGSQYSPFITKELQATSVGAGVGYEAVSHDGSQTSFASSRALLIIERGYTRMSQAIFEEQFHSKVYRWFVEAQIDFVRPPLQMPGYYDNPQPYLRARFSRPVLEWVDPWKDIAAKAKKIEQNLSTITDEAEDLDKDVEEIYATMAYEKKLRERYGIAEPAATNLPAKTPSDTADAANVAANQGANDDE